MFPNRPVVAQRIYPRQRLSARILTFLESRSHLERTAYLNFALTRTRVPATFPIRRLFSFQYYSLAS